jgi:hypothetical protein
MLRCCALQMLLLSTNQGTVVEMQVELLPGGTVTSKVVSQVTAAADPLSGQMGTTGGRWQTRQGSV